VDTLRDRAGRLDEAAARLSAAAHRLARTGPVPAAFGADSPGLPGELGRALHGQWEAATGTRAREAAAVAARTAEAAGNVRAAAAAYADTDHTARRRHAEGA
jgi:hypothetical protein